jgi:hypothetical protein
LACERGFTVEEFVMTDRETAYLLTRAKEEAVAAIQAQNPTVSAVHQRLSLLYSAKAIIELGHEEEEEEDREVIVRDSPIAAGWR